MPSGHDPMGGYRSSLATNAERVCAQIMINLISNGQESALLTRCGLAHETNPRSHLRGWGFFRPRAVADL